MKILFAILIIAGIGLIAGGGLSLASIFMGVDADEKVQKIREALPGANCGSCGFAGCDDYAAAIAAGKAESGLCGPGGQATAAALSEILGTEVTVQEVRAFVACGGSCEKTQTKHLYSGITSCAAAAMMYGGPSACKFGCLGFGDCAKVCEKNAISVVDGTAKINPELCGGCRKCAAVCPKQIIGFVPKGNTKKVLCSNTDKGAAVRKVCTAGCIGCKLCEKNCEAGAVKVENNLAHIDPDMCTGCGKCADACPQKCIK